MEIIVQQNDERRSKAFQSSLEGSLQAYESIHDERSTYTYTHTAPSPSGTKARRLKCQHSFVLLRYAHLPSLHRKRMRLRGIARHVAQSARGYIAVTDHVVDVITSCERSMYALGVLHPLGVCVSLLQQVFQSVSRHPEAHQRCSGVGLRGGTFRCLLTVSASSHSFVELFDLVCGSQLRRLSMRVRLGTFYAVGTMQACLIKCCHRNLIRTTTSGSDAGRTLREKKGHLSCQNYIVGLLYEETQAY